MHRNKTMSCINKVGEGIGVGIMAGVAATAAITISQMIEMRITNRKAGTGPAQAVEKTLRIEAKPGNKKHFAQEVHWVYGTLWGAFRGALYACGLKGPVATAIHFAAVTGTGMAMAPLEGQNPVNEWSGKELATDLLHHAIYAIVAGCVFDAIVGKED